MFEFSLYLGYLHIGHDVVKIDTIGLDATCLLLQKFPRRKISFARRICREDAHPGSRSIVQRVSVENQVIVGYAGCLRSVGAAGCYHIYIYVTFIFKSMFSW